MTLRQEAPAVMQRVEGNAVKKSVWYNHDIVAYLRLHWPDQTIVQGGEMRLGSSFKLALHRRQPFPFHTAAGQMIFQVNPFIVQERRRAERFGSNRIPVYDKDEHFINGDKIFEQRLIRQESALNKIEGKRGLSVNELFP